MLDNELVDEYGIVTTTIDAKDNYVLEWSLSSGNDF